MWGIEDNKIKQSWKEDQQLNQLSFDSESKLYRECSLACYLVKLNGTLF